MNMTQHLSPDVSRKTYLMITGIGKRKIWLHVIFCLVVLFVFFVGTIFYIGDMKGTNAQIVYLSCFLFLFCVYAGRDAAARYLLQGRRIAFSIAVPVTIILLTLMGGTLIDFLFPARHKLGFNQFLMTILPLFAVCVIIGIFIKLLSFTIERQYVEAEQKQGQLDLLHSQLSPHFLFNTLNNMYGISIRQQDRIPVLLLKLSDLLRYSLYETKQLFVSLSEEITYIKNYVEFETIRIGDRLELTTNIVEVTNQSIEIAPMLLIVFIENAFKHAKNTFKGKIYVHIELFTEGNSIHFMVKNSYSEIPAEEEEEQYRDTSGLGLTNAVQRLNILYRNGHTYIQTTEDTYYVVRLQLKIK